LGLVVDEVGFEVGSEVGVVVVKFEVVGVAVVELKGVTEELRWLAVVHCLEVAPAVMLAAVVSSVGTYCCTHHRTLSPLLLLLLMVYRPVLLPQEGQVPWSRTQRVVVYLVYGVFPVFEVVAQENCRVFLLVVVHLVYGVFPAFGVVAQEFCRGCPLPLVVYPAHLLPSVVSRVVV